MVRICWKAILEDEGGNKECWIPKPIREKILGLEGIEEVIERVMLRRTQK
jgi:hypothetical protein